MLSLACSADLAVTVCVDLQHDNRTHHEQRSKAEHKGDKADSKASSAAGSSASGAEVEHLRAENAALHSLVASLKKTEAAHLDEIAKLRAQLDKLTKV